ncbi:MAG: serine/threonine-protein kinase [Gemmatimonadaceae bacterium]|nr:serine/threonine-protein kinase [Gemmatimonadaceae bacterium]
MRDALGAGGAGWSSGAFDRPEPVGEMIALKTLHPDALSDDPEALERFKSELRLARRLTHRNIVRTYDLGVAGGRYWIHHGAASPGTSLRALLDREGVLPLAAALAIGKQLFRALDVAHDAGILHRDIKPQNLMVQPDGTLKVMDFGIARAITRASGLTQAGVVMGTPEYMAPEQLLGEAIDARSDLFSAGVVLFECVTGRRPIEAESPAVLIARMLHDSMPSAVSVAPSVPPRVTLRAARPSAGALAQLRPISGGEVSAALAGLDASRVGRTVADEFGRSHAGAVCRPAHCPGREGAGIRHAALLGCHRMRMLLHTPCSTAVTPAQHALLITVHECRRLPMDLRALRWRRLTWLRSSTVMVELPRHADMSEVLRLSWCCAPAERASNLSCTSIRKVARWRAA